MTIVDEQAGLRAECDFCGALPGDWCVYIEPRTVNRTPATEWLFARAGTPTKVLHGGRVGKVRETERRAHARARTADLDQQRLAEGRMRYGDVWASWTAERAFDRAEEARLATWLRQYAVLLIETGET